MMRRTFACIGVALSFAFACQTSFAQTYPEKPIRWIVPYAPGGGTDFTARYLSSRMKDFLGGQSFVVENKPGGATVIGTQATAIAPPDGYTIAISTDTLIANQYLLKSVPYKVSDLEPVSVLVASPLVLAVRADSPINSLAEAIASMRANDGKMSYGTWGLGSTAHLAGEDFAERAKVNLIHVPYQGAANSVVALLGGQIDFVLTSANVVIQHIREGKLKAIAVTTKEPIPQLPNVPTVASTFPGFESVAWIGVIAPKKTPKAVIDKLSRALQNEMTKPEVIKTFVDRGEIIMNKSSQEFAQMLSTDNVRIRDLVSRRKIRLEN